MAHAGFILRRKEIWAEKRAVHPVAKGQLGIVQFLQKFGWKFRRLLEQGAEEVIPAFNRVLAGSGSEAGYHRFVVPDGAACAARSAPVNPAAAPMPSISSQRGQVLAMFPCSARSITNRDIFSTTCSK